jgi:hypothetical protein
MSSETFTNLHHPESQPEFETGIAWSKGSREDQFETLHGKHVFIVRLIAERQVKYLTR